ncbi:MAG: AMP-binding protein, partial [Bacteroidetes bacterium]|nr:AMP-binding protein [Bacteroidota bacterium]
MSSLYQSVYQSWQADPQAFWAQAAADVQWYKPWTQVLDEARPPFYRWFDGGQLNSCYNALDYHVENGRAEQPALIYDSPVTDTIKSYSYRELRDEVALLAGVLAQNGVEKGDRVIIYMPMVPEAVMAMLACARIGAIHSVVFGGFAAHELAIRIDDAKPRLILSASCGIEIKRIVEYKPLLDKAIELAQFKPEKCLILQRPQAVASLVAGRDYDWQEALQAAKPVPCVPLAATDPLYILYTSGTTGVPKGVVRDNGGHLVALKWSMKHIYGVDPGDVYWAASDVGWIVGHSYIVYAPLFHGCTTILYEGKPVRTPDPGAFWRVIAQHKVNVLFTAPTAFRAIKREDPRGELIEHYDLDSFRALFLAGERCDPDTLLWAQEKLGVPVIDHWWQTESGWAIAANPIGIERLPIKPGSAAVPMPGCDVRVLLADGTEAAANEVGTIMVKLPLPPGWLPTLWNNDERFQQSYLSLFDGYYLTADAGFKDEDGYLSIMGRIDDIINVAGHRLSTGGMEEVLAAHVDVAEGVVIGVKDALKGEIPVGLVVLNAGVRRDHGEIVGELVQMVRERIGPVASFKTAAVVARLPKTRSGKILRSTIKHIADNTPYRMPATIDDPAILTEMEQAMAGLGFGGPAPSKPNPMADQTFRALVVTETEPKTFVRKIETRSTADLPPGDLLIRVHYSSLNYKDALSASGNRSVTRTYPHTPGIDAAGSVAASDSEAFALGDEVVVIGYDLGMNTAGGFGEYVRVPAGWVVKLPETLSAREAMSYGTAGFTAAMCVDKIIAHGVKPEDGEILVTGATGGNVDFKDEMMARTPYVVVFVILTAFVVLVVLYRSLLVPLITVFLNLLAVGAAYGVLTLVFQEGWALEGLLSFEATGIIESWLPLFVFTLMFGISMDYLNFAITRVE